MNIYLAISLGCNEDEKICFRLGHGYIKDINIKIQLVTGCAATSRGDDELSIMPPKEVLCVVGKEKGFGLIVKL
jgi:hypothetical protein